MTVTITKGSVNTVAVTLREKQLTDTTTYNMRLYQDGAGPNGGGYADPTKDDYADWPIAFEEEVTDISAYPARIQVFEVDFTTSELPPQFYTYVFRETVSLSPLVYNYVETGIAWVENP